MRVLAFGASVTQGFWDSEGGWAARLRKHYDSLQIQNFESDQPVIFNLGISADMVQDVLTRFKAETEARKRHGKLAFIFSIGTNNAAEGMKHKFDPSKYEIDLQELIDLAKEYSDRILLVGLACCDEKLTTPVFWDDVYYTNERIKAIEDKMQKVAISNGLAFLPLFGEFKKRQDGGEDILYDGLHPNDAGHELIAELVRPELDKLLV